MRVTFDSNTFEAVVWPDRWGGREGYPTRSDILAIRAAVQDGRISAFVAATAATLESVPVADRAAYLSSREPLVHVTEHQNVAGSVGGRAAFAPDHEHHPGFRPILADKFRDAVGIGFRVLHCPRVLQERPVGLLAEWFADPPSGLTVEWLNCFGEICDAISARGVGHAQIVEIGTRISRRHGITEPYYLGLGRASQSEISEIGRAVAEWCDGDVIAAHIAYSNDLLCTHDRGSRTRRSVFDAENRTWLESQFGVAFVTLGELFARLPASKDREADPQLGNVEEA